MNCKPGDLAVMVRSLAGSEGAIFTCIRLATSDELDRSSFRTNIGPVWKISKSLMTDIGIAMPFAADSNLRPIRDNDGTDETLTWAPKREGVTA